MSLTVEQIQAAYVVFFNRPADPAGLTFWQSWSTQPGNDLANLHRAFALSPEYLSHFASLSTDQQVALVYRNLLGREPDLGGLSYWSNELATGRVTVATLAHTISVAAQNPVTHADPAIQALAEQDGLTVANRVTAATNFTAALDTVAERLAYTGTAAFTAARTWLSSVNSATTEASLTGAAVNTAVTSVTTAGTAAATVGQTFTLTTGLDNFTGTAGNDTINASVSATAGDNTLGLADVINGGAGTDTLNVTAAVLAADVPLPAGNIQNVETVNIRALDNDGAVSTDAATFAANNAPGVTTVNADRSTSNVSVTGLANGAAVGMIGDGVVANGTLKYAYTSPAAAQTINISGGTNNAGVADITATSSAGVTTATINSTGAANSVDTILMVSGGGNSLTSLTINAATNLTATLTANDFATTAALTVSGAAASVNLGANFDGKTIDASGLTAGGLTIATNNNLTSFKGGQGNDTVTTSDLAAAAVAGAVDAGAGTADLLIVADGAHVDTAGEGAKFTNFEVLRNSGATDLNVSLLSGITSVQLNSADAGATHLTAAQAANIKVLTTNTNNTIALATATGSTDVLGLTLENATAAAVATAIDVTALTATGFETLNVVSSSGTKAGAAGVGNDLAFAAAANLTAINVSGAYDLTIATANITKAVNITSTQTGTAALHVSGNLANGSSVTGSGGADTFTLGTGFGTFNGGAGNDTFNATAGQLNTGADYNVINGGDGADTLNITSGAAALTIVDNNLRMITGVERIVVATTTTNAQWITTGGWFDAAFKASGVDLTTTSTTGDITIDTTSFTGAAKITATTVGVAGVQGTIFIQTGTGADEITVSAAAAGGAGTVKTFAGNDRITTAGTEDFWITAGAGNDTIVLNSTGIDTLVFEATAALNGVDTITGFIRTSDIINWDRGASEVAVTGALTTTADAFYQLGGLAAGKADTADAVAAAVTAAATWTAAAAVAWIAVSDDNSTAIYEWADVAGTAGVQAGELTLVATIGTAMNTLELGTAIII